MQVSLSLRSFVVMMALLVAAPTSYALDACDAACQAQREREAQQRGGGAQKGGIVPGGIVGAPPSGTGGGAALPPGTTSGAPKITGTPAAPPPPTGSAVGAAVCPEPSSPNASRTALDCDMRYRQTIVTGDLVNPIDSSASGQTMTVGTRAPYPSKPMPMIDTPLKSYIKDYSPYLFAYARDEKDSGRAYSGTYYRGAGGADQIFNMFGNANSAAGPKFAACTAQIKLPDDAASPEEQAKAVRMQVDICTNHYILQSSLTPFQKELTNQLSNEDSKNPGAKTSTLTECQPFAAIKTPKNEYNAADYLKIAWKKLLNDPSARKTEGAKDEPHYPDGLSIKNGIPLPDNFPGEISLSQIAAVQTEEIVDPSHPFSPRWDYTENERDKYSPKTAAYGGDPKNGVFCAGDKVSQIVKVDILTFREKNLKFDEKVSDRIEFNKNCKANSGLQKNPCCLPIPDGPNPLTWKCKLQPCAKCYGMKPDKPVCSTDYLNKTDRRNVRPPYLPVNPVLRVAAGLENLQAMALDPQKLVGQATNSLKAQLDVANILAKVAPGLPMSQLTGILKGQVDVVGLAKDIGMKELSGALNIPTGMLEQLSKGISAENMNGLLKSQVDIAAKLGGLGDVNKVMRTITESEKMINQIAGIKDVRSALPFIDGQTKIMASINSKLPIGQALSGIESFQTLIGKAGGAGGVGGTPGIAGILPLVQGQVNVVDGFAKNLLVGTLQNSINGQLQQIGGIAANVNLGDALKSGSLKIDVNLKSLGNLPLNTSMGDVRAVLDSLQTGMKNFAPNDSIGGFAGEIKTQGLNITAIAKNLPGSAGDVANMLGSLQGSITSLSKGGMGLAEIPGALAGPLGAIRGLGGDTALRDVSTMLGSLQGGIQNISLTTNLPLGKLGDVLGGQVNGILKLGGGFNAEQLGGLFGAHSKMVTGFLGSGVSNVGNLQGILSGNLTALAGIPGTASIGQFIGSATGQLNGLAGIAGNLPIGGNLAASLNAKLPGALGNVASLANFSSITKQIPDLSKVLNFPGVNPLTPLNQLSSTISASVAKGLGTLTKGASDALAGINRGISAPIDKLAQNIPGLSAINGLASKIPNPNPCSAGANSLRLMCVLGMPYLPEAKCNPNEFGAANKDPMANLCKQLRAPYVNLNKLKMRYHNPDDKTNIVLKEGVQEGLSFKDYFNDTETKIAHMPYPMLWDTGRSIQATPSPDQVGTDVLGQYTSIVGVGREAAPDSAAPPAPAASLPPTAAPAPGLAGIPGISGLTALPAGGSPSVSGFPGLTSGTPAAPPAPAASKKATDQRCLLGGWGGEPGSSTRVGGVNIKVPDPITSWTELKLYQTRALRNSGLSCLARYEKVFKPGSAEGGALLATGAEWNQMVISSCLPGKPTTECTFQTLKEYRDTGGKNGKLVANTTFTQLLLQGHGNQWRGYMASKTADTQFPNFGGKASTFKGLEKAELGDLILMPNGASKQGSKPGLAKVALVTEVNTPATGNCNDRNDCYVRVVEFDNGKWPDVCGTTDSWGEDKNRTLYKPGNLPVKAKEEYARLKWTGDCADTKLSACEMSAWDELEVYRIRNDVRKECDKETAAQCQ